MSTTETQIQTLIETEALVQEESQVIVHCTSPNADAYRIWPSTYLIEGGTGKRVKLITAFNISFAPQWTLNNGKGFTLVFEGLSRDCVVFDLVEIIPQPGGFEVKGIARNNSDVYTVSLD